MRSVPISQDGLGLNPVAGGGDDSHQYFGEASVAREVKLAKNAVVLLNHLCYASGISEPEPSRGHARSGQAAGRQLRGGLHPRRCVGGRRRGLGEPELTWCERSSAAASRSRAAWRTRRAPSETSLPSRAREAPGSPRRWSPRPRARVSVARSSLKSGLARRQVLASAAGPPSGERPVVPTVPTVPSLVGTGLSLGSANILGLPTAGKTVDLLVPYKVKSGGSGRQACRPASGGIHRRCGSCCAVRARSDSCGVGRSGSDTAGCDR